MPTAEAPAPPRRRRRLRARLHAWLLGTAAAAAGLAWAGAALGLPAWLALPLAVALAGLASAAWLERWLGPVGSLFRALEGTVSSYRDGDYAFSIAWPHDDELQDLVQAHNQLGQALREQRLQLVQRELLLDTMVQQTPVAMLLADAGERVVYANLAARHLVGDGRRLEGLALPALRAGLPPALAEALAAGREGLITVKAAEAPGTAAEADDENWLLSQRDLVLAGQPHRLLLLRRLTQELRRQEVQSWKKLIRVISHELNNSLAPIASLAFSGRELARRGRTEELPELLATIEERARHLDGFIRGYAQFAKLPSPQRAPVAWRTLLQRLQVQEPFHIEGDHAGHNDDAAAEIGAVTGPDAAGTGAPPADIDGVALLDAAQIEQALINLLRNARESGSPPEEVALRLRRLPDADGGSLWCLDVLDRGPGMSDAVMAQALTPFYSTKRQGTGLGLALAREIAEAHGGRLLLQRREGGGLCVSLRLPAEEAGGPASPGLQGRARVSGHPLRAGDAHR